VSGTVTLWRPAGSEELALVEASGWRERPPRLPGKSIFYPVLSEEYAAKIARGWNVPRSGVGYVTGVWATVQYWTVTDTRSVTSRASGKS
jgi:hypothetical protein